MELAAENTQLKAELVKLKAELALLKSPSSSQTHVPPAVIATDPVGHSAPAKEAVSGLRLRPIFEGDRVVEIVAQVIPDLKKKRRKHKNKRHGVHSHAKGKNKRQQAGKPTKPPKILAETDASAIIKSIIKPSEQLAALKRAVKDKVSKVTPIKEVAVAATIEELLEAEAKLKKSTSFYLVNLGAVVEKWHEWHMELPNVDPFYAVKSNPDINIVRTLATLGGSFDCASRAEIEEVMSLGVPPSRIIFANPCKGVDHIQFARERGVDLMTFDNAAELQKIKDHFPAARIVLRVLADDSYSLCPFGTKFGASKEETVKLLALVKQLSLNLVGVSFHVGSSCQAAIAWAEALRLARSVFDLAAAHGMKLTLVDMGGGWPGTDTGKLSFPSIAAALRPVIAELFPPTSGVRVISEPGRFFCTSSYTLAVTVNSKRERWRSGEGAPPASPSPTPPASPAPPLANSGHGLTGSGMLGSSGLLAPPAGPPVKETLYYLSDGIYGSFNNIIFDHAVPEPNVMRSPSVSSPNKEPALTDSRTKACLFGPTCDSIDVICKDIELPDLSIGDWLYFRDMGAYTVASSSAFNGFHPPNAVYWMSGLAAPAEKKP